MNYSFTVTLQKWYINHKRPLPWRDTSNPYLIWLSEIILQQTRVSQGLPYYERFVMHFPTITDLANASEDEILRLWQGLGYYSRGRNMLKCAKLVVSNYNGAFPTEIKEVKKLPGIGDYTASAILSFAFNQVHPVLDGNVYRVLSRYYGIDTPINTPLAFKTFKRIAGDIIDVKNPAQHNQAIMEFGALQCTPKNPDCMSCVFNETCVAAREDKVQYLPVKLKARAKRNRHFNYIVFLSNNQTLIKKRMAKDIWQGLFEFPLVETTQPLESEQLTKTVESVYGLALSEVQKVDSIKHLLTHQTIYADFWLVTSPHFDFNRNSDTFEVDLQALGTDYAIPVLISKFLESPLMKV